MAVSLNGKTVLVTAAAQGIGRATALAFAAAGARVVATDVNEKGLAALAATAELAVLPLDVLDGQAVAATVAAIGPVDVLVNCAGYVHSGSVLEVTDEAFDFAVDLNVHSMVRTIKAVLPAMLERGDGSIVNIASVASSMKGIVNRCVYGTTKAAVLGLTKSVAVDYVAKGVRCNAVCPGTVETPSLHDRINAFADPVAARKAFIARQPMGRLGTAEEIASMCLYLASDESVFVTGQAMVIDGGITL